MFNFLVNCLLKFDFYLIFLNCTFYDLLLRPCFHFIQVTFFRVCFLSCGIKFSGPFNSLLRFTEIYSEAFYLKSRITGLWNFVVNTISF